MVEADVREASGVAAPGEKGAAESERSATGLLATYGGRGKFLSVVVHPSGGGLGQYVGIIASLTRRGTVHAIRGQGLGPGETPDAGVGAMVERYLPLLRALPRCPDLLIGWSLGGVLAWELAAALAEEGHRPAVIMLDSFAEPWGACADHSGRQRVLAKVMDGAAPSVDEAARARLAETAAAHITASAAHRVKGSYAGPVLLMPCRGPEWGRQIAQWSSRAPQLTTVSLDCGHFALFERENLRVILRSMDAFLAEIADQGGVKQ